MIGLALQEWSYSEFWVEFLKHFDAHHAVPLVTFLGTTTADADNRIVEAVLADPDWDRLVLVEHDHVFPAGWVDRVRSWPDDRVVGAFYVQRRPPYGAVAFIPNPERERPEHWRGEGWEGDLVSLPPSQMLEWLEDGGRHRVLAVGLGCISIPRWVLERWPRDRLPWFQTSYIGLKEQTSDLHFCRELARQGVAVEIDMGLQLGHLSPQQVNWPMRLLWLEWERERLRGAS